MPPAPRRVQAAEHYRPLDGLLGSSRLRGLVDLQNERDAAGLIIALGDADPVARARAAFALASVQDSNAVPTLIGLLSDTDARVRADAAFALGQIPSSEGAAALLALVRAEPDTVVLTIALDALGRVGGEAELWALADAELTDARDGAPSLAAALALAYARFGMRGLHDQGAAEWVVSALSADSPAVRQNAGYYFARSRDPQPWAPRRRALVHALDDYGLADRAAMHLLTALARLEDADDVERFTVWLEQSPDWAIRVSAARALGRRADHIMARDALVRALRDPSHHVQRATADALAQAQLEHSEADALIALLSSFAGDPPVHGALLRAIATAGATDWVLQHWLGLDDARLHRAGLNAIALVPGGAGFSALEGAARGGDSATAAAAIEALVQRRALDLEDVADPRYFAIYSEVLRTRERAGSATAAGALADSAFGILGAGSLLQSVYLQLSAPDELEVMVEIVRALGALRDSTAVPLLREARTEPWPTLRAAAAEALARITGEPAGLPAADPEPVPPIQWEWLALWGPAPRIRLETERGTIVLELSVEQAPLTAQTLLTLVGEGRYDGVPFHRVVPNFVIQGGDVERGDGWGGPGFTIRSEFTRIPFLRGTGGIASSGKDTEGSQYFVTHSMQPHLDGRYTAFATLVGGLGVLDAIREGDLVIRATAAVTR